jgi:hypothetical protein
LEVLDNPLYCYELQRYNSHEEMIADIMSIFENERSSLQAAELGRASKRCSRTALPISRRGPRADGLPVGVHFAGRYGEEATLWRWPPSWRQRNRGSIACRHYKECARTGREHRGSFFVDADDTLAAIIEKLRHGGDPPVARHFWKPVDQRSFSLENSSRTEPRNFTFGRSRLGARSALSRAHSRKRGDCLARPLLPCLRLPIPPRPCCMQQV